MSISDSFQINDSLATIFVKWSDETKFPIQSDISGNDRCMGLFISGENPPANASFQFSDISTYLFSSITTDSIAQGGVNLYLSTDAGSTLNIGSNKILDSMINTVSATKITGLTSDLVTQGSNNIYVSNNGGSTLNIGANKILDSMINSVSATKVTGLSSDLVPQGSNNIYLSNNGGSTLNIGTNQILDSMINSVSASKVTGVLSIAHGGTGTSGQSTSGFNYFNGTAIVSNIGFYRGAAGQVTLSESATTVTAPTIIPQLNYSSPNQGHVPIIFSGQEWYQASNTSSDGIAFLLGKNRTNDRELWVSDSANLTRNSSNPAIRIIPGASGGTAMIDCVSTDGSTFLPIQLGSTSSNSSLLGNTLTLSSNALVLSSPTFSYNGFSFQCLGSGSPTSGLSVALFAALGPTTAANLYGIGVNKSGTDAIMMGVNKNSTTGDLASNTVFISSYNDTSSISIGRGGAGATGQANLPWYTDLYIDSTGDVGVNRGNLNVLVGNMQFFTAGKDIIHKIGTNGLVFNVTLVAGTVTVSNPNILANATSTLTVNTFSGVIGNLRQTITAGQIIITSSSALDTSTIRVIIHNAV